MTRSLRWLLTDALPPLVLFALVLLVWEAIVVGFGFQPYLLPSPRLVLTAIQSNGPKLSQAIGFTGAAAIGGLLASLLVGTAVALVFSQSRFIRSSGYPYAIFLQTVPIVAIAPLIVHWCGRGFQSIVLTSFIISLFPIIANGTTGLLSIDPDLLDLFRLNNASRWQILWKLRFPSAIPAICTGARTATGLAVVGAIVGEFFAGYGGKTFGLGYLIMLTSEQSRMADLFAAVLACTLLGVILFGTVNLLTAAVLRKWYDHAGDSRG